MDKEFVPYDRALRLKALGFDEPCFNRFYTKPQSKMFGVDEKGRHYPIKNISKKLYTMGEDFVLNDSNVILAPTFSQAFRWFRENYGLSTYINLKMNYGKRVSFYVINELDNILVKSMFFKSKISIYYNSYEEAELACLDKLLEIVELNQNKDDTKKR